MQNRRMLVTGLVYRFSTLCNPSHISFYAPFSSPPHEQVLVLWSLHCLSDIPLFTLSDVAATGMVPPVYRAQPCIFTVDCFCQSFQKQQKSEQLFPFEQTLSFPCCWSRKKRKQNIFSKKDGRGIIKTSGLY